MSCIVTYCNVWYYMALYCDKLSGTVHNAVQYIVVHYNQIQSGVFNGWPFIKPLSKGNVGGISILQPDWLPGPDLPKKAKKAEKTIKAVFLQQQMR